MRRRHALLGVALLASSGAASAQEFKGELCLDGTPFCWVPLGRARDCAGACARSPGPQRSPTDGGDALAGTSAGSAPHFICRARGAGGEGWRPGFNLKAGAGPPECEVAAGGTAFDASTFECLCHAAPSSPGARPGGRVAGWAAAAADRAGEAALSVLTAFAGAYAAVRLAGVGGWSAPAGGGGGGVALAAVGGSPRGGGGGAWHQPPGPSGGGGHHFRAAASGGAARRRASATGLSSMLLPPIAHGHGSDEEGGGGGGGGGGGAAAPPGG